MIFAFIYSQISIILRFEMLHVSRKTEYLEWNDQLCAESILNVGFDSWISHLPELVVLQRCYTAIPNRPQISGSNLISDGTPESEKADFRRKTCNYVL